MTGDRRAHNGVLDGLERGGGEGMEVFFSYKLNVLVYHQGDI